MGEALAQFMIGVGRYLLNLVVWLDQGLNTLTGGDPDETVSSRAAKSARRGHRWGCVLCRAIDWIDRGHCERVIETDEGRDAL